ncbi:hypothetical protein CLBKI_29670 [Clostridium beijerinckii]|jgi:hypothetical protein|uniref:Uncharacterized protein n=2 Tax=Clostridium beijerinckii TaxID=1520 RepID=A6LUM5_CLOB8|nr:hypothetical protein Cbei_1884 [Clostridium beijerinckii NCIMB 8052]AIU04922.1 hypothetical protein Cbs_1884 [Clostridium beijerinckii ATCC 35702]OOM45925.1 hypothetical protein CLOSB_14870 [Clostridium beijerinckii]OOM53814.1 hypothetical protein CLBKI_29670 [Clostridium beijerinckii]
MYIKEKLRNVKQLLIEKARNEFYNSSVLYELVHLIQLGGKFMKKSTIIIMFGIVIIVTAFLGMDNNKMYQKQKHFETVNEVLDQLNDKPLKAIDDTGKLTETNEFKECFSERKRLTNLEFNFSKVNIEKVCDLNEKDKSEMLSEYDGFRNNFSKRRPITREEPVSLIVDAYNYSSLKEKDDRSQKLKVNLVLVDEGEGLVIDYIMYHSYVEGNDNA